MIRFTDEQNNAIKANGTVLVAAAAGSGKTAVLVERILKRFCDEKSPLMADRTLIVTFTNAAAAELKQKIEKGIKKKLEECPDSDLIKKQNLLIQNAFICTIDSFCINLVRENFNILGIANDFKIADTNSNDFTKSELLDLMFSKKYEENNDSFYKTISNFKMGYDDSVLKSIITKIYNKSCAMPYPEKWLDSIAEGYQIFANNFDGSVWKSLIISEISDDFKELSKYFISNTTDNDFDEEHPGYEIVSEYCENLNSLGDAIQLSDWTNILLLSNSLNNFKISKKTSEDLSLFAPHFNKKLKSFKEKVQKYLQADKSTIENIIERYSNVVSNVVELVKEFKKLIDEKALEENCFTFDQIEHMALNLISGEDNFVIENFNNQFDAILVDEYQDTSNLQDELFKLLSAKKGQLFMVGDVKQSIYGFRNANPDNFLYRKEIYPDYNNQEKKESKVLLSGNFRSRENICKFINYIFRCFMTKSDADMDYDEFESLIPLGKFTDNKEENDVEIYNLENNEENLSNSQYEAKCIAEYIIETLKKEPFIDDGNGGLRKANFNDFALLMRSPKNKIAEYVKVFKNYGIPVNSPSEKYSESIEIKTIISLLKTINNPNDNIALFGTLTSVLFTFSEDEIANIRIKDKYSSMYSNLLFLKDDNKKIADFIKFLNETRILAATMPIHKLLIEIFNKTSIIDIFSSFENGNLKKANLYMFIEHAEKFASMGDRSIPEFIKYIEADSNNALAANIVNSSNAVQIMSIHNSKGLQFPICILCALSTKFNMQDTTADCIIDDNLGVAFKYYDEKLDSIIKPVSYICLANVIKTKLYKEELRLLYVALTRAKDKLALFITKKDIKEYLDECDSFAKIAGEEGMPFKKDSLSLGTSYADWMSIALAFHKNNNFVDNELWNSKYLYENYKLKNLSPIKTEETIYNVDSSKSDLKEIFNYEYPFKNVNSVPAKTSVTDILKKKKVLSGGFLSKPSFLAESGLSPAQIGTANHKFMEFCDFDAAKTDIDAEIERLVEWKFISEQQGDAIDKESISAFFSSFVYEYIKSADKIFNEYRFITKVPCNKINPEISENISDYTLVQGVADCVIIKDNKIFIVDYKTDNSNDEEYYKNEYSYQLNLYAFAISKIFNMPVEKKIIYSFKMKKCIEI